MHLGRKIVQPITAMKLDVVPFTCEACGISFPETQAVVCPRCGRVLCPRHFSLASRRRAADAVCRDCRKTW